MALDVASGTGAMTLPLAERVGPSGRVLAVDISPAMVEIASAKSPVGGAKIEWHVAPAESLPFEDASVDHAYCQQGLQFFPDHS